MSKDLMDALVVGLQVLAVVLTMMACYFVGYARGERVCAFAGRGEAEQAAREEDEI